MQCSYLVKVYDHLTPETYQAILEAAREHHLPVIGHVPLDVGLEGVLAEGQLSIETGTRNAAEALGALDEFGTVVE